MAYKYFAAGYLVKDKKVLLVHHKKFDKWTPPGGHFEEEETPEQTVAREFFEETSLRVKALASAPPAFAGDSNATPIPLPFHMDLEREGFDVPHIGFFYFVEPLEQNHKIHPQEDELHAIGWFGKEELRDLKTFEQVKALASYAIDNYPKTK